MHLRSLTRCPALAAEELNRFEEIFISVLLIVEERKTAKTSG